jgi:RimJ/RimL family protein N-acetyltransferase/8-oxo-dGTP pyrophosphatase MutT (NUDIX family)
MSEGVIEKVAAYITHGNRLLVFSHPGHPEAGIQVPGGAVESGEAVEEAVLREAKEETGLDGLELRAYLGVKEYDLSAWGLSGVMRRHFYHLALCDQSPERWRHYEQFPSDGSPGPIEFELFWVAFPEGVPELAGGQGDLLYKLTRSKAPLTLNDALHGGKICLRPPRWGEMSFVRWLWADPDTMAPVGGPILISDEDAKKWYARMVDPGRSTDCYCLIFSEENKPVGEISFHRWNPEHLTAGFNIKISSGERRRGHAKKAMLLFLDYFFNRFGGQVLTDDVALDNEAGQQALLKFGFEHDPTIEDVFMLRMTRDRFNTLYCRGMVHE